MKIEIDIDYAGLTKNIRFQEGRDEIVVEDGNQNIRDLWDAMDLLKVTYIKAMDALSGMHAAAIRRANENIQKANADEAEAKKAESE